MPAPFDIFGNAETKTSAEPLVRGQFVAIGKQVLCLRKPAMDDASATGKLYATIFFVLAIILSFFSYFYSLSLDEIGVESVFLAFFAGWAFVYTYGLKVFSHYFFNRHTKKVYHCGGYFSFVSGVV